MSKRMFIAFKLPSEMKNSMLFMQHNIRENLQTRGVKWVPLDNMHITVAFLGQVRDRSVKAIKKAIDKTEFKSMNITVGDIGFFRRDSIPSVMYLKPMGTETMEKCANRMRSNLSDMNIHFDRKPFAPHITLARMKHGESAMLVYDYVNNKLDRQAGAEYTIKNMVLYESTFTQKGPVYTEIYQKIREFHYE